MKRIFQRYASAGLGQGLYVFFSNFLEKFTFFILFVFLARYFNESAYGVVTAAFAFANILMVFFEFGFTFYFQREAAANNQQLNEQLNQAVNLRLLLLIPYSFISAVYFYLTSIHFLQASLLLSAAVFGYSVNSVLNAVLLGKKEFKKSFFLLLYSRLFLLFSVSLAAVFHRGFRTICATFAFSALIHIILLLPELRRYNYKFKFSAVSFAKIKPMLNSALPIGMSIIFVWIYDKVDILILRYYNGDILIAIYAVAYSIYKLPQALAGFIFTPLFSDLSGEFASSGSIRRGPVLRNIELLSILLVVYGILGYLFADQIFSFIYGAYYTAAAPYFRLLIFALPGLFLNNFTGTILNSANREKITAQCVFISALTNIVLNLILIPVIGAWGAAAATVVSEYITFFYQYYYIISYKILK